MNKLRALTLAFAVLAILSEPATAGTTVKSSKSNSQDRLLKATVTKVDQQARTFSVEVTFSAATLNELPTVGANIDITYDETPSGLRATTVKSGKSNSSERVGGAVSRPEPLNATVTKVNQQAKTFTVEVKLSSAKLSVVPSVGAILDITYTVTGGGTMAASNLDFSKSNVN